MIIKLRRFRLTLKVLSYTIKDKSSLWLLNRLEQLIVKLEAYRERNFGIEARSGGHYEWHQR